MSTKKKERLQLTLHATGLKNVAGLGKGTSDPFAVVVLLANGPGETPKPLGKTEVIKNTLKPNWTTAFLFDYEFGKETFINVRVDDEVRKSSNKPMGSCVFEIGEVLGSPGSVKGKKLKKGGTLYVRLAKAPARNAGKLGLRLRGTKLKNVEGLFKKSDPFYTISRTYDGPGGGSWTPVYRSKHIKNNLDPKWEPATIDVNALCDGDLDRRLEIHIQDHEGDGKHDTMGKFETTVNGLLRGGATFVPKKRGKAMGTIAVDEAKITGADDPATATATTTKVEAAATAGAALDSSQAAADPTVVPVPVPVAAMGAMSLGGAAAAAAARPKPTFIDYIRGNLDVSMTVAIDFTGSNGDPRRPGTLHHISPTGQMNGYEKVISAVGGILKKYDTDQMFPVYGFGAKYGGVVRHCFQVGQEPEVRGIRGILDAYKGVFRTPLIMSGPTVFAEVIALAAQKARSNQQTKPLSYTILLLLTDGAVTDVSATQRALAAVADAPLSIVIVGIGNADFSAMQFLDDFESRSGMNRDIVQFVQFNRHEYDKTSLTRATLEEIPDQVVQFFQSRGIQPQPNPNYSVSKIVVDDYNEEADIDLNLTYQDDGEIDLSADQPGAYVDNNYGTGLDGIKVMQPPPAAGGAGAVPFAASAPAQPGYNPHAPPPAMAHSAPSAPVAPAAPAQGYNPYGAPPAQPAAAPAQPAMAVPVPVAPQPMTFQVQVPPGVSPGMQIQVAHPQTGQPLVVAVPPGVPPGGVFSVSA